MIRYRSKYGRIKEDSQRGQTNPENSLYANKLTQAEIENARKEVEIELRNKNFKTKNF